MGDKQFVIWAELVGGEYELGMTDARYHVPRGVAVITIVDDIDLGMMTQYVNHLLLLGWLPEEIRAECGEG